MNYTKLQNIIQEGLWRIFESIEDEISDSNATQRQVGAALGSYGLSAEYMHWRKMDLEGAE